MKKLLSLLLSLTMLLSLVACGGTTVDPALCGKYIAVSGEAFGMTLGGDELNGFSVELKDKGKATMTIDGTDYSCKWSHDDATLTLKVSGTDMVGDRGEDSFVIDDVLGQGMKLTFAKEGSAAADPGLYLTDDEKAVAGNWSSYAVSDVLGADASDEVDPEALKIELNGDHSGAVFFKGDCMGEGRWSVLGTFGSFDEGVEDITFEPSGNDELEVTYTAGDDYYVFHCVR